LQWVWVQSRLKFTAGPQESAMIIPEHERTIFEFYQLMYQDERRAHLLTAEIVAQISQHNMTLNEWADNALSYHALTPQLRTCLSIVSKLAAEYP